jgi:hypothetical protein
MPLSPPPPPARVVRPRLPAAPPTRPAVAPAPRLVVVAPPAKRLHPALVVRPAFPQTTQRPTVGPVPPSARPGTFEFRLRPLVARIIPPPPVPRPTLGQIPPAPQPVVTRRPPAAMVVRVRTPPVVLARSNIGRASPAHRPPPYLLRPVIGPRIIYPPLPLVRPRTQAVPPWQNPTPVPVFPFGPRFTIRDPGLSAALALQGVTFTVRDPGLSVQLPRE